MNRQTPGDRSEGAALLLLSLGITAYQLALMQVLSFVQWYHFAYMVVAIALLGFGASGTFLSLFREKLRRHYPTLLPVFMTTCGLLMSGALAGSQHEALGFDLYLLFVDPDQLFRLLGVSLLFFCPFFFGALAVGMMLIRDADRVGSRYAANLAGSGLGGVTALLLLEAMPQEILPSILSLMPICAALLVGRSRRPRMYAGFSILVCIYWIAMPNELLISQYKSLRKTLDLPGTEVLAVTPSAKGTLHLLESEVLRAAPGLSLGYGGAIPSQDLLFVNGEGYCSLPRQVHGEDAELLRHTPEGLALQLRIPERAVILQADPSLLLQLLAGGAGRVEMIESHSGVRRMVDERLRTLLPDASAFRLIGRDPRSWLDAADEGYDLIRFPFVGSFHGGVGLFALNEQYLLTIRSFARAWRALRPEGMLSISCWMDYPERSPLKVLATLVQMLEDEGVADVRRHLVAIRSWNSVYFAVSRRPFSRKEFDMVRAFCADHSFDPLLLPNITPQDRARYNQLESDRFFDAVDQILTAEREQLYQTYDFNLRPATDSRPYFSQFLKAGRRAQIQSWLGLQGLPFLELGSFILVLTLVLLSLLALVLILLPLCRLRTASGGRLRTFLYFGSLGCGYMMVEIVLMQRMSLLLGHPLIASAAVISALLFFSGLGSLCSARLREGRGGRRAVTGGTAVLVLVYGAVLMTGFHPAGGYPLFLNLLIAILVTAPLAFLMGFPFPLGLRGLWHQREEQLAWAWGINGCISVISPACAVLLAIHFGFPAVFFVAAAAYVLAACTAP